MGSLTQFQKSLIIGTVLGDGYLRIIPGRNNAFLEINHSFSQKQYVDWKFEKLQNSGNSNFYLNTQQFNKNNQIKLLNCLEKIGLRANLNKDKNYYRIRFLNSSTGRLKELLKENLIPSMYYKLGYNPVET